MQKRILDVTKQGLHLPSLGQQTEQMCVHETMHRLFIIKKQYENIHWGGFICIELKFGWAHDEEKGRKRVADNQKKRLRA